MTSWTSTSTLTSSCCSCDPCLCPCPSSTMNPAPSCCCRCPSPSHFGGGRCSSCCCRRPPCGPSWTGGGAYPLLRLLLHVRCHHRRFPRLWWTRWLFVRCWVLPLPVCPEKFERSEREDGSKVKVFEKVGFFPPDNDEMYLLCTGACLNPYFTYLR